MGDAREKTAAGRIRLRVLRQDAPDRRETRRFEEFDLAWSPRLTVQGCLERVARSPRTTRDDVVAPVVWDAACVDGSCGACTMRIDGEVGLACCVEVPRPERGYKTVTLEPLEKFPLVRDLAVDRSRMTRDFARVAAWAEVGDAPDDPIPDEAAEVARRRLSLSRCTSCGACLEACPEVRPEGGFVGAATIAQARLANLHRDGGARATARVDALMESGGIAECGKAQVCVEVCPEGVPLVEAIGEMARATTKRLWFGWLR